MKIKQVEKRVNASYNTIKKFVESDSKYYELNNKVIHVTKLGLEQLETKYGLKSEVLGDHEIVFYKTQLMFMEQQLNEFKQYNQIFLKQLETNGDLVSERDSELEKKNIVIEKLKKEIADSELDNMELKHQLELEVNKSVFKKIFKRKKSDKK